MKVIITGGTGLIGAALAKSLAADRHDVIVLSRSPQRATGLPASVQVVAWDGRSAKGWGHLADGADAIVNLAGESLAEGRWTAERKRRIQQSRLDAGQAVVEAIQAATQKPGVLVQSSAVGYYGPRDNREIAEDTPPGNDFLARVCVAWEASTAAVDAMGVRRVLIRTGIVLSLAGGALPRLLLPFKLGVGGPLGRGEQPFPWIHLDDEVAAIRFLLEHPTARGPFNLTAPQMLTNAQFGQALAKVLHRPALLPTPAFALKLALGEMAAAVLEGQQAVPRRLQELGFQFKYPQAAGALEDLVK